jgi:hypothetical protein
MSTVACDGRCISNLGEYGGCDEGMDLKARQALLNKSALFPLADASQTARRFYLTEPAVPLVYIFATSLRPRQRLLMHIWSQATVDMFSSTSTVGNEWLNKIV